MHHRPPLHTILLLLFISMWLTQPGSARGEENCALQLLATLPVTYDAVTHEPIVTVFAGARALTFAVATTAGYSVISPALAAEFGLTKRRPEMDYAVQMAQVNLTWAAHIPLLHIGRASLSNADFFVGPRADELLKRHDGVLGQDILHLFDVEYDFGHNIIKLFASDHCPGKVVYWSESYGQVPIVRNSLHFILFNAAVDGKTLLTELDTRLTTTAIPQDVAQRQLGLGRPGSALSSLEIGDVVLQHPDIRTDQDHPLCDNLDFDPGLGLGLNHLKKFRIFVAWNDGQVYFIPSAPGAR